jgi:glutamate-1-semialdehyde 2,1-aminomutase
VRDLQSALKADTVAYGKFFNGMLARGVFPPPSQFEAWFLSGAHTEKDVEKTVKAARAALVGSTGDTGGLLVPLSH